MEQYIPLHRLFFATGDGTVNTLAKTIICYWKWNSKYRCKDYYLLLEMKQYTPLHRLYSLLLEMEHYITLRRLPSMFLEMQQ
jgi:hypothetical protein